MKTIQLISFLLFPLMLFSQDKEPITIKFHVESVCGMCETAIERALDAKGIIAGDYDLESTMATVTYKPWKITEPEIHALINAVGYDTEKSKCTDEQYSKVHGCCKYRELTKH
ncbi:MAG: heavy-metal-associated domain-containing protein [Flavobacteriales bacterium]